MKKLLNIYFKFINRFRCISKNDIETKDLDDIENGIFLDMVVSGCIWFIIVIKACVTYQDSTLGYAEQTATLIQEICRSFQS